MSHYTEVKDVVMSDFMDEIFVPWLGKGHLHGKPSSGDSIVLPIVKKKMLFITWGLYALDQRSFLLRFKPF